MKRSSKVVQVWREMEIDEMRKGILIYGRYVSVVLRSAMQYRLSFFLMAAGRFLIAFNGFLGIYFLFSGFSEVKGYTYGEILLCFSIMQLSFSLAECCTNGFKKFSGTVKKGEFDRMLVRPISPMLQVLGSGFDLGRLAPALTGIMVLFIGIKNCSVHWTVGRTAALLLMLLGGIFLFAGLFMIEAAVCFFSIENTECMNVLTYGAKEHGKYPIDIYGKGLMRFCTYVIPYTLVQYYPLQYLLGKTDNRLYAFCPLGVTVFVLLCCLLWRTGVRHYKSTGS